jgi:ABC-2 type transport system ATP-binding protein
MIFLDEPTTGFDPEARRRAWDVIRGFVQLGKTVLLTTHYLDEAEALADRVGVIVSGELSAVATPAELGGRAHAQAHVRFELTRELAVRPLPPVTGDTHKDGATATIVTDTPTAVVSALTAWAREAGIAEIPGLTVTRPSLEDVYLQMIGERAALAHQTEVTA